MKIRVVCLIVSVADERCYQGELTMGSCKVDFKLLINNDLFEEHYDALTGEDAEETEMGLIRKIVNIVIEMEGRSIDLTDEAYSFIYMLLMRMKEQLVERSSRRPDTQKAASFEGDWDFPPDIDDYLDPILFPGIHANLQ